MNLYPKLSAGKAHQILTYSTLKSLFDRSPIMCNLTGEKRQSTTFTPRLGRELAKELLYGEFEELSDQVDDQDLNEEIRSHPPFAPRLGRQLSIHPTSKLGRQLRQMLARI